MLKFRKKQHTVKYSPPHQNDWLRTILRFEQFEDRVVPANLEVTTLADVINPNDGVFSLRERIDEANEGADAQYTIFFRQTLWGGTITLNPGDGQLQLEKNIFIDGPANKITIQRDPAAVDKHRIFDVLGTSVTLARLRLLHGELGFLGFGGAIQSTGSLTVQDCEIRQCKADIGGAIYTRVGTLNVTNSVINGNTAEFGGGIGIGQAVYASISNSVFVLNRAYNSGGGIFIEPSQILNETTTVTLNAVQITGNLAANAGGGIYVHTSGVGVGTWLTLAGNTDINNNVVQTAETGKGGGLYFGFGFLTLSGVTFASNSAALGDGMYRVQGQTTITENPVVTYVDDTEMLGPPE